MLNNYDIIVLTIIIIIIAIIIVINVKKSLNNKLSNIEIKIPEIEIPQQNIVVKIQRKCDSDKYDVHIEKNDNIVIPVQKIGLSPINTNENFDGNIKQENPSSEVIQKISDYDNTYPNTEKYVRYPDQNNILTDEGKTYAEKMKLANNAKVQSIIQNDEKDDDQEEYDTLGYVLSTRRFIPTSFDDGVTKGYNIGDYWDYGTMNDIGKILLGKDTFKYAKPNNYIFSGVELNPRRFN